MIHTECHRSRRSGWLRSSVLGANDGIVSTSSLIIGVAAANTGQSQIMLAGLAGLVSGAMSMAAGEYVSVSSQSDSENADLNIERQSIEDDFESEREELAKIYEERGVAPKLAGQVAEQLMAYDALGAHARDEIGITEEGKARPIIAALSSAAAFTSGAALPLSVSLIVPLSNLIPVVALFSLVCLGALGCFAAYLGGAPVFRASMRVSFCGALAMLLTALIGRIFGIVAL